MASTSMKRMRISSRSGSVSGKVLGQNSARKFRKCSASRSRSEEEEAGLHLVVRVWNDKKRHRYYSFFSCDQKWSSQSNYPRFPFPTESSYIIGSCNGLLCLETLTVSSAFQNCFIWEPSTNKLQLIPQPDSMKRPCCKYYSSRHKCMTDVLIGGSGLFFDSRSGDYKFLCFTTNFNECSGFPDFVQLYSVKNNSWKELSCPLLNGLEIEGDGKGICVNGVCYWTAHCANDFSLMLSFDFATEEFSTFHGPKNDSRCAYEVVELDGSLGVLIYPRAEDDWEGVISLMVYSPSPSPSPSPSWSRVDHLDDVPVVGFHEPLWFGKRNDSSYYLLLQGPQGVLLEYDYTRKVFNQIHKMPVDDCYAFAYETKTTTKNNADIWHSSSFHEVEVKKRFTVYASHQTGDDY